MIPGLVLVLVSIPSLVFISALGLGCILAVGFYVGFHFYFNSDSGFDVDSDFGSGFRFHFYFGVRFGWRRFWFLGLIPRWCSF